MQIIHEGQLPQMIELGNLKFPYSNLYVIVYFVDTVTEVSLFTLYSRQAVLSFLGNTQISSFAALGGVKNIGNQLLV